MRRLTALLVALAPLAPAGAQPAAAPALSAAALVRAARPAIDSANAAWLPAMKSRDAAAIAEPYADDAVFVLPGGESARGRPAIEGMMRDRFARGGRVTGGRLVQDGLTAQGSQVYEWGHAEMDVVRDGAPPAHVVGRYLTVWQRDAAGRWRITRNLSLPD